MRMGLLNELEILRRMYDERPEKRLVIAPIIAPRQQFQPSSVDLRLGTEFLMTKTAKFEYIDLLAKPEEAERKLTDYQESVQIAPEDKFVLHPGEFVLGCTLEYVRLPSDLAGRLEGKSTWGRMGLQIHSTAGFVDPGFAGALTFELQNVGRVPIPLYPGLLVAQICFFAVSSSAIPYGKKQFAYYGGWPGLQASRYHRREDIKRLRQIHEELRGPGRAHGKEEA